jgi:eukaryotic translation initiation factor 2C
MKPKPSVPGANSTGLAINVDVANGTFWASQDVHQAARNLCSRSRGNFEKFQQLLLPIKDGGRVTQSEDFKNLRKMVKLKFTVKHRGKQDSESLPLLANTN